MDRNQSTVDALSITSKMVISQSVLRPVEPSSRWLRDLASVPLPVIDTTDYSKWARGTCVSATSMCSNRGQRNDFSSKLARSCGSRTPRDGLMAPIRAREVPGVTAGGTDRCNDMRPTVFRFKHITNANDCDSNKTKLNNRLFLGRPHKGLRILHSSLFAQTGGNHPRCPKSDTDRRSHRVTDRRGRVSDSQTIDDGPRPTRRRYVDIVRPAAKASTPSAAPSQVPYYMRKLPAKVVDSVDNTPHTKLGTLMVDWQRPDATGPTGSTSPPCCQVVKGPTYANAFTKDTRVEHSHPDQERQFREAVVAKSLTTNAKLCQSTGQ